MIFFAVQAAVDDLLGRAKMLSDEADSLQGEKTVKQAAEIVAKHQV